MNENNWKPPELELCEEVVFYADGDVTKPGVIARAVSIEGRCLTLVTVIGQGVSVQTFDEVLHWKDPWLDSKPNRRQYGCWQENPVRRRLAYLEDRLAKLEAALGEPVEEEELVGAK